VSDCVVNNQLLHPRTVQLPRCTTFAALLWSIQVKATGHIVLLGFRNCPSTWKPNTLKWQDPTCCGIGRIFSVRRRWTRRQAKPELLSSRHLRTVWSARQDTGNGYEKSLFYNNSAVSFIQHVCNVLSSSLYPPQHSRAPHPPTNSRTSKRFARAELWSRHVTSSRMTFAAFCPDSSSCACDLTADGKRRTPISVAVREKIDDSCRPYSSIRSRRWTHNANYCTGQNEPSANLSTLAQWEILHLSIRHYISLLERDLRSKSILTITCTRKGFQRMASQKQKTPNSWIKTTALASHILRPLCNAIFYQ